MQEVIGRLGKEGGCYGGAEDGMRRRVFMARDLESTIGVRGLLLLS